jgi:hypothetical protein
VVINHCSAEGRIVSVYSCNTDDCREVSRFHGTVNYLIIATRAAGLATKTSEDTWGQVKVRYR